MEKVINTFSKYQRYLLGLAIFLSLFAVSITIGDGQIRLNLKNYPTLMLLLVLFSILLIVIHIGIDKLKINSLSDQIRAQWNEGSADFNSLILTLTKRQKEVYELIALGKSNKEIMTELFIEQSTLKTHINQIYKKLNIKSRRELRSNLNRQ